MARDTEIVADMSKTNVAFKASVVEGDEREKGRRAILNLGHTTAHALEVVEGYGSLGHGRAVALGLLVALAVSESLLGLDASVRKRTHSLLREFGLPTSISLPPAEMLVAAMAHDKKVTARSTGFVGLRAMGDPVWGLDVPTQALIEALEVIKE
jgi:3-dehydroquinate synthase